MKKRRVKWLIPLIAALLGTALSGCNYLIEGEYTSVELHEEGPSQGEPDTDHLEVKDYGELKNAIIDMVKDHVEKVTIRVQIDSAEFAEEEIIQVLDEVTLEPIVAYASSSGIRSYAATVGQGYVDVELTISYQKTAQQIAAVDYVYSGTQASEIFENLLSEGRTYYAMLCPTNIANINFIEKSIKDYYLDQSLDTVLLPQVQVSLYPSSGTGSQRIAELELDFGCDQETLADMKEQLQNEAEKMVQSMPDGLDLGEMVIWLGDALCKNVSADQEVLTEEEGDLTGVRKTSYTAYGALVEGTATSEGYAMAFKALCDLMEIECRVVMGAVTTSEGGSARHVWNIVKLEDGCYYHMDISRAQELGYEAVFIANDESMMFDGGYSWDTSSYSRCEGEWSYTVYMGNR